VAREPGVDLGEAGGQAVAADRAVELAGRGGEPTGARGLGVGEHLLLAAQRRFERAGIRVHDADVALDQQRVALVAAERRFEPLTRRLVDQLFVATTEPALTRLGVGPSDRQDLAQQQRIKLLVGTDERGPALASYAGRGSLAGWLRASAVRAARNARRQQAPAAPPDADEDGSAAWAAVADDPELGHLKQAYCDAFRRAADAAFAGLSPRSRLLLKQHLLDEMAPGVLATFYGVHQATIYRWLEAVRGELVADTRRRLASELCLDDREIAQLMNLLQSQLEVSVRRLLAVGT
jgi:RNA polymerase sigma-70 factor, ECF subfamily